MPASKAQQMKTAARRAKAIGLYLEGLDWQAIADKLGYASRGAAHTDVMRSIEKRAKEEAENVATARYVELQRLARLRAAVWPSAIKGDVKAVETALRISERWARLQGLDAPRRVSVEAENLADEIAGMLDQLTTGGDDAT